MISEMRERPVILRQILGEPLRGMGTSEGTTLRPVSGRAQVSLGYLSEIERGQKEASSELLNAICGALGVPLSNVLRLVSDRIDARDGAQVTQLPVLNARDQAA